MHVRNNLYKKMYFGQLSSSSVSESCRLRTLFIVIIIIIIIIIKFLMRLLH